MKANVPSAGQLGRLGHKPGRHGERRAGGEGYPEHRIERRIVKAVYRILAGGQYLVQVLDYAVRGQPAL